ncbi:MAG: DNA/RNA endonuclease [Marinilabiliales bacterium]|nr:MAG: DNA/RNA endonuclease [Marinilabiliales bacterium]
MYKLFSIILTFVFSSGIICFAQISSDNLSIPKLKKDEQLICHQAYCLVYSEEHEQAKWVAYQLTDKMLESNVSRNNKFIIDPLVTTGTANNKDYKGSGYDRGHLAPSADMCYSQNTMEESFYYSNMSPQLPGFNRGIWKTLESNVRTYAEKLNKIYIVTGPILKESLPQIGENQVDVPEEYFKAILFISDTCSQAIAFVLPNNKIDNDMLFNYVISIDELEKLLKVNLFYKLPFLLEKRVEKKYNKTFWLKLTE